MSKALQLIENSYVRRLIKAGLPRNAIKHQIEDCFQKLGWKVIRTLSLQPGDTTVGWIVTFVPPPMPADMKSRYELHSKYYKNLRRLIIKELQKQIGLWRVRHVQVPERTPHSRTVTSAIYINER